MDEKINEQATTFTISAVFVGLLMIPGLNVKQQNDLGNWLMLVGQVLCTNAARIAILKSNEPTKHFSNQELSYMLEKAVCAMQQEIDELKKQVNKTT